MNTRIQFCMLLAVVALGLEAVQAAANNPGTISLSRGTTLLEAIQALQIVCGGSVIAEKPVKNRLLREALRSADLADALNAASRDYDLYWEMRKGSLALHRRLYDPDEHLAMEEEEARLVADDLRRLVAPFSPNLPGNVETVKQNAFAKSLTGAQRARMQRPEGLPFSDLTPGQQEEWLIINRAFGFQEMSRATARVSTVLAAWKRLELQFHSEAEGRDYWWVYDPRNMKLGLALESPNISERPEMPSQSGAGGEIIRPASALPTRLRKLADLPDGEYELSELMERLGKSSGTSLTIPVYAMPRRVVLASKGASVSQVVQGIKDLYGWDLTVIRGDQSVFRLDRPKTSPAADVSDLHAKVRRVVPPAVLLWWFNQRTFSWHSSATYARSIGPVFERLAELRRQGKETVSAGQLGNDLRRRTINSLFSRALLDATANLTRSPEARPTLTNPAAGWFTLSVPKRVDALPMLVFHTRFADGVRVDQWGWALGSSTLESGGR